MLLGYFFTPVNRNDHCTIWRIEMACSKKWFFVILRIGLLAVLISGCNDDESSNQIDPSHRMYLICAENGSLTPDQEENVYVLTLKHVSSNVRWYADRPERLSGIENIANYVNVTWPAAYGDLPPNTVIRLQQFPLLFTLV